MNGEDLCGSCYNKLLLTSAKDLFYDRVQQNDSLKQKREESSKYDLSFKDLLYKYVGEFVGVNHNNPTEYDKALLISVNDEFFSISSDINSGIIHHYPYNAIMSVLQTVSDEHIIKSIPDCKLLIQIQRLIVYKGASGLIIPLPLGILGN
ncbi:hypothetical protein KP002_17270 [Geomonas subterranea]|uniref:hypothetical protein n=1 Tax=Geomonas subterranea TaxID=2847989 RepID=UPI001C4971B0|nr:hypothetical protein [Geomonas subterranea]QXM08695.1 hypothetical protein KP002_17270 [Geomonas subterranea]